MENGEIRRFFQDTSVRIEGNPDLREPQLEAYAAAVKHFSQHRDHAILQLPVGCGKTGLMAILPFGVAEGRVLVIVPNLEIRRTVSSQLDYSSPDCFWRKTGVLADFRKGPHLAVLEGASANMGDCRKAHFVVTNIHQLASAADRWLSAFSDDFFDLILVDEGHHNVASSWQKVFERFPSAKVLSLTATPFRADGQEVSGVSIYRYSFSRAMQKGYIKRIRSVTVAPSEIYFSYQGDDHHHTLEEVLALREEDWFRRGVALSRETNVSIVDASIQCLEEMRSTGMRHQIIAAGCSINHAREIAALYRERNYEAETISSALENEEREEVIRSLHSGRLDCIVQVRVLGEGFDHPPLSVAAIFRPFRSLSPYVQFVGRVMRVIHQNAPIHPDNEAYVVSHVGLQQDERWEDFKRFDEDDQLLFAELVGEGESAPSVDEDGNGRRRRLSPEMVVLNQVVDQFLTDEFLSQSDQEALDTVMSQIQQTLGVDPAELGLTRDELAKRLKVARGQLRPQTVPVQPQRHRQEMRRRLDEATRSVAGRMLKAEGLAPQGVELVKLFPGKARGNNMSVAIRLLHGAVNEAMGFAPNSRGAVEDASRLEEAIKRLDECGDQIQGEIAARRGKRGE